MATSITKFTPRNILIKWPRIVWRKFWYRAIHGPLKQIYFGSNGFHILKDVYGTKFRYHAWDTTPLNKILPRENHAQEFAAFKKLIKPGNTVFDVGANIGLHSVFMSRLVGPQGSVHVFEPVPDTFAELKETLKLNKLTNVTTINAALYDQEGTGTINVFDQQYHEWSTFGSPSFDGVTPKTTVEVRLNTLDAYCEKNNIDHIDFLKIDVEGFEKQVISGALTMLRYKKIDYLSFEISEIPLKGAGITSREVFDLLESVGYTVYKYDNVSNQFIGPMIISYDFHTNLYASWKPMNTPNV